MGFLLPLLILAIDSDVPLEVRFPEAATVFHCAFDGPWDENFDGWPDGWTRRQGPGFPHYVKIRIDDEPSPAGERSLRIEMDGGAAVAYSPPIQVGPLFSYVLEGYIKTEGLKFDRAYLSLTLLNADRHRLQTSYSQKVRQTEGWQKFRLGPVSPDSEDVRIAIIGLHVQPEQREDLRGGVLFDDIWLGRLPRMSLNSGKAYNFFTEEEEVRIDCTVSGFLGERPEVTFQLEDVLGNELARRQAPLATRPASTGVGVSLDSFSEEPLGVIGKARWEPPLSGQGFYRVRATMKGRKSLVHQRELNLVVVEPRHSPAGGEFGWALPRGSTPMPLPLLSQLVGQAGINWVKYPLWYDDAGAPEMVERLITFGERLSAREIELIGLLHDPPQPLKKLYGDPADLSVATIFAPDPKVWYPSLEPVMARLATRIRWWQLGDDTDTSYVGYPRVTEKIAQIKAELDRIGQDVNLSIGWQWIHEPPQTAEGKVPWRAVALSADPPMTHQELSVYLDAPHDPRVQRWVVLEPIAASEYPIEVRANDLVRRMIAAKIRGADAVFCPEPFSTEHGLMNDDGTPGELFLAWRTTALVLGGTKYLGSIELPNGSQNQVFAGADGAVMVVWNEQPTQEVLYLGEDVRQIDVWGCQATPAKQEHRQVIEVDHLPEFLTGLSEPVARWRMDFAFEQRQIPSVFGRPHRNGFRVKNYFPGGAGGQVELVMPEIWSVEPRQATFQLAGGEELRRDFQITFPFNATSGRQQVRADFEIQADRPYRFSVFRHMDVGLGDVYIEIVTRLNSQGELEVEQRFVNETGGRVSFRCQLFAPGRRRQKTEIIDLGSDQDVQRYRFEQGAELLGKPLWLKAKELDGPRILNYRFVAEP
ncbi:MAG: hypothetical protein JXB62_16060 [Pirellulales bacterium]|nr:hypothetical protein [Pirellulales bacterium]